MIEAKRGALVLAPMDGITDAPMRALQGASGAFTYAVSEFIRVSGDPIPKKVFLREIPELTSGGVTQSGLRVQVQILGGNPERMAQSAFRACEAGALGIDINFGCPAPTVNRHDGGASLLQTPCRVREIVAAVRAAVPEATPVSAKLRLGWHSPDTIFETAAMAEEGGASWITIHARTKMQGYRPPVSWPHIGAVRRNLGIPVVANGDIWSLDDFRRCQDETGCEHFMIGRGALANPMLPYQIARELGIGQGLLQDRWEEPSPCPLPRGEGCLIAGSMRVTDPSTRSVLVSEPHCGHGVGDQVDWVLLLNRLVATSESFGYDRPHAILMRLKQWLNLASLFGDFAHFRLVKKTQSLDEFFGVLAHLR